MGDGISRHTPTLAGDKMARVIVFDASLAPFVGEALTLLTNRWTWLEVGDPIDDIIDACFLAVDTYYLNGMIGTISAFLGDLPPYWLALDGSTYDQGDYPELSELLDAQFRDDQADEFTLPDFSGIFPIGLGGSITLGDAGGENSHTLTEAEMPAHTHTYTSVIVDIDVKTLGAPDPAGARLGPPSPTSSAGSGNSHENRPPFFAVNYGIFSGRIPPP